MGNDWSQEYNDAMNKNLNNFKECKAAYRDCKKGTWPCWDEW